MKYNKVRHLELLRTVKNPAKDYVAQKEKEYGGPLGILDILDMPTFDQDENLEELENLNDLVCTHLHWENRIQYFELIQEMLESQSNFSKAMGINFKKLTKKFDVIEKASDSLLDNAILLELNKESEGFVEVLDDIFFLNDKYSPTADPEDCEEDRFPEKEYKTNNS